MKNIILFLITNLSLTLFSQPNTEWKKTYGGSEFETAHSIIQTNDGGLIVAGFATSDNSGDVDGFTNGKVGWIIKLDINGNLLWQKNLGGDEEDMINSIIQTTDGGYIVAGESNSDNILPNYGDFDYWIVKLDSLGNTIWENKYGGTGQDRANSIYETADNGYIIAGESTSTDGDVTNNKGRSDFWVVKINNNGALLWEKSLGGSSFDTAQEIKQTTDGGYIVVGTTYSSNGDVIGAHGGQGIDIWAVKLNNLGNIVWQKPLGGSGIEEGYSIKQTSDGGYIIGGITDSLNGDVIGNDPNNRDNFWIVKLDHSGTIEWQKCPIFLGSDYGRSIIETTEGDFIIAGYNYYDLYASNILVVKLDDLGNLIWYKSIGNPISFPGTGTTDDERAYAIIQVNDGGFVVAGYSSASEIYGRGDDFYVIKIASENLSNNDVNFNTINFYPNPTKGKIIFNKEFDKIEVYDNIGRIIKVDNSYSSELNIDYLPNGIYYIKVFVNKVYNIVKIIKE